MRVEEWWRGGQRGASAHGARIFTRVDGDATSPWLTLVHGFPTSSFDWVSIVERLRGERRILVLDLIGFGDSDKPRDLKYSLLDQADAVVDAWRHHGVSRTGLVAHDYGTSVAQELLARRDEGKLAVDVRGVAFLNGGMIPSLHRPVRIQALLAHHVGGRLLTHVVTESMFRRGLRRVVARPVTDDELHEHWRAWTNRGGRTQAHRLLRYLDERRTHAARWEGAVQATDAPLRFVWGPLDPISGAHMIDELRRRRPDAAVRVLDGVGHYPQWEAPDDVAAELRLVAT